MLLFTASSMHTPKYKCHAEILSIFYSQSTYIDDNYTVPIPLVHINADMKTRVLSTVNT
jgi:hypothetical protein